MQHRQIWDMRHACESFHRGSDPPLMASEQNDRARVYDPAFYANQRRMSYSSACAIVPLILEKIPVESVVDVGSGIGTWLAVFRENGVMDAIGLDGDYVQRSALMIPADSFRPTDLSQPFRLERRFDLAVSLEVAEHLPYSSADGFVDSLVALAPCVLFSAGLPFQGGTDHINEQWPEFWVERFAARGYTVIDYIRRKVWKNPQVQPCYAQNTFLFVETASLHRFPRLETLAGPHNLEQLSIVHPDVYLNWSDIGRQSFRTTAHFALRVGWNALKRRARNLVGG